ncbi:MAG: protein kinase, partial [Chloroflexota bacterium]
MSSLLGQSLGRYHILEQLGEGGMATVYKAYDTKLERDVAVKIIRTDMFGPTVIERMLKRFEREAKVLGRLSHPNIVKVMDYGEHEGSPFIVMEYLPGGALKQKMRNERMPWREATRLLVPIARALAYAHEHGMIHRDVKPSNVLIAQTGEPMLTDFGIAKILDTEGTGELTGTNTAIGTPDYMAPEQITSKNVDARADVYALGIVYYEMVTGRRPFVADTPMAVLFKQASEPLPRPTSIQPDLPESVERILIKALAKNPDDRYETMTLFANALENLVSTSGSRPTSVRVAPARKEAAPAPVERTVAETRTMPEAVAPVLRPVAEATYEEVAAPKRNRALPWVAGIAGGLCLLAICVTGGIYLYNNSQPAATAPPVVKTHTPALPASPHPTTFLPSPLPLPSEAPTIFQPPTPTPAPAFFDPTPTPAPALPFFTASEPMFCREGPGTNYEAPWELYPGQTVPVIGAWHLDFNWILVDIDSPDTRTDCCWVSGNGQLNVSRDSLR